MSYLMLVIVVVNVETIYENLVAFEIRKLAEFLHEFCKVTSAIARIHWILKSTKRTSNSHFCNFAPLLSSLLLLSDRHRCNNMERNKAMKKEIREESLGDFTPPGSASPREPRPLER